MPRADAPLRRHTLVTLTAAGWSAAFARDPALAADPVVRAWAADGRPLIVRRATPDEADAARVPLGIPLPPAAGKRRVALNVAADAVAARRALPALADVLAAAPAAWQPTLRELAALGARCGVEGRVFGSLAWQTLTGERYLSDGSDLDVVFPLPAAALRDALLDGLAALDARAPMRIDGELLRDDGAGVNWRELYARLPEVAVKTALAVELMAVEAFARGVR
ncbi:malonate decarboxylase holo-[acyl-carrier-protein] synthase [Burkholderia vietnamiensis]|uniref:malonate decarboxylase holo-[acyl-carrier-protein] synthase n=1 Tax=Burkholderia vietnamiensis TaxID=60552 RepID=UPI00075375D8|nr:malonate decarboxylase holo-[acyl-carrier-protein] synthase [Burkholderia vietnamiensis]KVF72414.1 phosphoribosyl-dephospho-CoA transferase [Burkholderia vietnamiensis]KVR83105.1 phosphoribosyl-dephospho-CoA transferase [Burkholderia vietnamiensis]KVS30569.1 phosphoribosyl-dephospho-CoA transferase [Burkholderia vietnamiensis]MBR8228140.1 malonate decarboxylase holo-[acyl-carrier-protein] synthase [Burkholderia vietnamiensis]MCA8229303.1 malonate decarboxylase holo-[acyl-carrier-protein] sy